MIESQLSKLFHREPNKCFIVFIRTRNVILSSATHLSYVKSYVQLTLITIAKRPQLHDLINPRIPTGLAALSSNLQDLAIFPLEDLTTRQTCRMDNVALTNNVTPFIRKVHLQERTDGKKYTLRPPDTTAQQSKKKTWTPPARHYRHFGQ